MKKKLLVLLLALTLVTSISSIAFGEVLPPPIREESVTNVQLPN